MTTIIILGITILATIVSIVIINSFEGKFEVGTCEYEAYMEAQRRCVGLRHQQIYI